jgi:phosphatidylglycerophosphate synthase
LGIDRERLRRLRNWQSTEFYSRLVMRPLSILILLVAGDWRWLTPNLVTTFANITKLAGAALVAIDHREYAISANVLLQVGLLFDHLDGTLARYRRTGSTLGAFYDKVSDAITWGLICGVIGWAAYRDSGNVWLPIAAIGSAYALLVLGYMKWIVVAEQRKAVSTEDAPRSQVVHEAPSRTPREWAMWFGSSLVRVFAFEEVDLFFWIGIALIVDRLDLLIWMLAITQGAQMVIMVIKRGLEARALDVARKRAAA